MAKEFEVWAEKYRPKTFDEIINQESTVERVKAFAKSKNIPHMLFAGPPGSGKCLEKGSLIFTFNGLKKVEEIKEGHKVLSLNPTGKFSFHMVKGIIEREDRIYSVETYSGCKIGVTFEHPFLTLENGLPTWKSVKELKEGDFVAKIGKNIARKFGVSTKNENTNDAFPFAAESVRFVMSVLGFAYEDLTKNKKELESLFRNKKGNYRKVKKIYETLLEKSREKIIELMNSLQRSETVLNSTNSLVEEIVFHQNISNGVIKILTLKKLITTLELLDFLVKAEIFWDRIKKIEEKGYGKVYDLEIENSHNFVGGNGLILHNTTLALVLARELYGDQWRQNVLQTNASDERKIEVIRGKVKEFARTVAIGDVPFKLIILDEADALTNEAQQALRRMMEMYASVSRFVFCVNYSSKIIEPLQSRCAVFRFKALDDKHVEEFVDRIVKGEKLKITEDGIKAVVRISEGDLRKAANILQVASALKEKITEDVVYEAASLAKPQEVKQMLELALSGKFMEARKMLEDMIIKKGLAGTDIVVEIHRQIPSLNIDDRAKVELIEKCGEVDFRISEGANELIQLESLLASFLLYAQKGKK
jgi:replication factor C small subunit